MSLQSLVARVAGDIWATPRMLALWPWPAVLYGTHGQPGSLFTEDDYRFFTRMLEPGDMLVTRSRGFFLSNRAIPGAFKHLAVYVGAVHGLKDEAGLIQKPRALGVNRKHTGKGDHETHERCIVHAVSEGVQCLDVLRLLFHSDYVGIVRAWRTPFQQAMIVDAAAGRVGLPYNFDFTPKGPPASYCTELGAHCLTCASLTPVPTCNLMVSLFGGRADVPIADMFAEAFGLVGCSRSCSDPAFYRRAQRDKLRQAVLAAKDCDDQG